MSFSETYDVLRTKIDTYFTARNEMNDPYNPESGKEDDLKEAWGLLVGSESTNETFVSSIVPRKAYTREFGLILSDLYVNSRGVPSKRVEKEQGLITDGKSLVAWLETELLGCPEINSIKLTSDNGIEFLFNDRYITITFNLEINYQEN